MIRTTDGIVSGALIIMSLAVLIGVSSGIHAVTEQYEAPIVFAVFIAVLLAGLGGFMLGRMVRDD